MRKSDIVIGGVYSNGKSGRFYAERKVIDIDITGKYKSYNNQADKNTVLYETIKGYSKGSGHMTLISFSSWAKSRVS